MITQSKIQDAVYVAFADLNLTPREGQDKLCEQALSAFLLYHKKNVILDSPTGAGKSIIGVVIHKALGSLTGGEEDSKAVIVTGTNALARQYEADFSQSSDMQPIYGAVNYPCTLREAVLKKKYTAEQCYRKSKFFYKDDSPATPLEKAHCTSCTFALSRVAKAIKPLVVTNYAYFILDRIFMEPEGNESTFRNRSLYIFDEAHLLNEMFVNHCAIYFSEERAEEYADDMAFMFGEESGVIDAYEKAFEIIFINVRRSTIGPKNVEGFLRILFKFYAMMMEATKSKTHYTHDEVGYDKLKALYHKYHGLYCKIDDYFKYRFEIAVTCEAMDPYNCELSVKPIFVKDCFKHLQGKFNLFMSATLNEKFLVDTLQLDMKATEYIRAPYSFNANDKVVRIPPKVMMVKVNYQTMQDPNTLDRLGDLCNYCAAYHEEQSGIVITTSFLVAEELAKRMSTVHKVILHRRGQKVDDAVDELKHSSEPSILLSPSVFEGIDLPGECSRFQIITKAPFYSLADKRMTIIMRKHRQIYTMMTVMRLTQGLGRSTRYRGDVSTSYFLDTNLTRIFNSKYNTWRNQFEVQKDFHPALTP